MMKMTRLTLSLTGLLLVLAGCPAAAGPSVQDDDGHTLTLQKPARRIISLAPHVTELLFAAGGGNLIVGAVNYSDYPEAAQQIPRVGDNREIDIERVIALKPDLLVVWRHGSSDRQVEQLRQLGIPLFYSEPKKLDDIAASLILLGRLMGTEQQANAAAADFRAKLRALTDRYAHSPPVRVFYQVWDKPLYTLSGQHIVSDALRLCGGVNIFSGLKIVAPNVGIEAVLQEDPEAIIGSAEINPSDGGVAMWKRYPGMTAVRRNNLFLVDGNLLNRAGPRLADGAAALCARLDEARANRKRS